MTQYNEDYSPNDASPMDDDDDSGPLSQASSAATSSNTDLGTLHQENHQRYLDAQAHMDRLSKQYSDLAGQNAGAYAEQRKLLKDATDRLNTLSFGPTPEEAHYRNLAAFTDGSHGGYGFNPAEVNSTKAELLKEGREGELQKAQLMAQYGMQIPQATLQANNQAMTQNLAMQRIYGTQTNNAAMASERGNQQIPWYVKPDGQGGYYLPPGAEKVMDQVALTKLFGKFALVPQPDGSKKLVPGAQIAAGAGANAPQPPQTPPQVPGAPPATAPPGSNPKAPLTPPQSPGGPPVNDQYLSDLFQPSSVLDPKYGNLTMATKPAYVETARSAFEPSYFQNYQWQPKWGTGTPAIYKAALDAGNKQMGELKDGASDTIRNYGQALHAMDSMNNDPKLLTGTFGEKQAAFENMMRGVIGDQLTGSITGDKDLQALATKQDSDKYFLQAATTGLKAIYGGRITNMEVQQRLKSLPSSNLMPAVARLLANAQAEVAQDQVNKANLWGAYVGKGGDPNISKFNTWYDANFSPFSADSRLKKTLAQNPVNAGPSASDPKVAALVGYYNQLAQWKAQGQKGPPPVKPQ